MAEELNQEQQIGQAEDYDGSQIQVLEGLEAVRKRPGMYIGSTGPRGLHHLVYEIVDNAIDEALAGFCDHIEVTIKKGNIVEVTDNGRGIPVDIQPKMGIPAVTVVFTILHAGGKFGGDNSGYKVAGGLHGVGASVVNALSEWLEVRVRKAGSEYVQTFRRGVADGELKKVGPAASSGTVVTFKADPVMFTESTEYDYETLRTRLREEAFLNAGVRITLTDERGDEVLRESMCYEGGVRSFVEHIHEKRRDRPAIQRQLQRAGAELCQQCAHPGRRHPRGGLQGGPDPGVQRFWPGKGLFEGKGRQPFGQRRAGGPDRGDQRKADRRPVRGPDQGKAG